jgi:hypothetical protein
MLFRAGRQPERGQTVRGKTVQANFPGGTTMGHGDPLGLELLARLKRHNPNPDLSTTCKISLIQSGSMNKFI